VHLANAGRDGVELVLPMAVTQSRVTSLRMRISACTRLAAGPVGKGECDCM
jgi:hypothetical protein